MEIKEISSAFYLSRNTVRKYVRTFQESGLSLEKVLGMSDASTFTACSSVVSPVQGNLQNGVPN